MNHVKAYTYTYVALMGLLGLTVGAWFIDLGAANIFVAMAIALAKAFLVIWIFMHVREGGDLVWVYVCAGIAWLTIATVLTFADYLTRSPLSLPH